MADRQRLETIEQETLSWGDKVLRSLDIEVVTGWYDWRSIELSKLCACRPRPQAPEEAPFGICAGRDSGPVPWQLLLDGAKADRIDDTSRYFHTLWSGAHLHDRQVVALVPSSHIMDQSWRARRAPHWYVCTVKANLIMKLWMDVWHLQCC